MHPGPRVGIGMDNNGATQAMIEFCNNVARSSKTLFQNIAHPQLPKHVGEVLLRVCVGPRMNFILRSTPENLTRECAEKKDTGYDGTQRGQDVFPVGAQDFTENVLGAGV